MKPKRSYIRVILPNRIFIYMLTISEQTNFAQLLNAKYFLVSIKKYIETKFTYKCILIYFSVRGFFAVGHFAVKKNVSFV